MKSLNVFIWTFLIIHRLSSNLANVQDDLQEKYGKIIYMFTTFRHGDRAPVASYSTDPHNMYKWQPDGPNQLLPAGKQRAFQMGRLFRNRYAELLGPNPSHTQIRFESSDVDRAIASGLNFMAAFFPSNESYGEGLIWNPVPIHVLSSNEDMYIVISKPCPRLEKLQHDFWKYDESIKTWFNTNREVFEYIQKKAGLPELDENDIAGVYLSMSQFLDTIRTQEENNLELPEWTKSIYPQPLGNIIDPLFSADIEYRPEMKRLHIGPLMKLITEEMDQKLNKTLGHTFRIHSGHDGTIAYAMRALNIYEQISLPNPFYSSALTFELREKDDKHYVTVTFQNDTMGDPRVISFPQCEGGVCEFSKFKEIYQDLIPEDRDAECQLSESEQQELDEDEHPPSIVDFQGVHSRRGGRARARARTFTQGTLLNGLQSQYPSFYVYYPPALPPFTPFVPEIPLW